MNSLNRFTRKTLPVWLFGAVILVALVWLGVQSVSPYPWSLTGWELPYSGCSNWCN